MIGISIMQVAPLVGGIILRTDQQKKSMRISNVLLVDAEKRDRNSLEVPFSIWYSCQIEASHLLQN